jgi:hypothetical protein
VPLEGVHTSSKIYGDSVEDLDQILNLVVIYVDPIDVKVKHLIVVVRGISTVGEGNIPINEEVGGQLEN